MYLVYNADIYITQSNDFRLFYSKNVVALFNRRFAFVSQTFISNQVPGELL